MNDPFDTDIMNIKDSELLKHFGKDASFLEGSKNINPNRGKFL